MIKLHEKDLRDISRELGRLSVYSPGAAIGFGGAILGLLIVLDAKYGGTVLVRTPATLVGSDKAADLQKTTSTNESEKGESDLLCTCGLAADRKCDRGPKATQKDK